MVIKRFSRLLKKDLKPSLVWKGFYVHPSGRFLCSPDGSVVGVAERRRLPFYIGNGYYSVHDRGHRRKLTHRLIAETFLENLNPEKDKIVNHIDGVKTNPNVFNLEWCDDRHNVNHALDNGLRGDNIVVDVRNLETGEVLSFRSYTLAANHIGVNPHIISSNIKRGLNKQYTIKNVYEVKLASDSWALTKNHIGKNSEAGSKGVVVRKIGTEVYFLFSSATAAGDYLAIKPHMLYSYLNNGSVDMRKHGYDAWYLVDIDVPITDMIDMRVKRPTGFVPARVPKMIEVFDRKTKLKTIYNSTEEFAGILGVKKKNIQSAIRTRQGKYFHYTVRYL
ncbi:HNH endonuclease [Salmonella enterica subsp. enterica serovar Braenderup]